MIFSRKIFDWVFRHKYFVMLLVMGVALSCVAARHYAGSGLVYGLFCFVSLLTLSSGLLGRTSYTYLFLVIFLYLGFWFKLIINSLIFEHYCYGESVGRFDGSSHAWDMVLWIAIAAHLAVLLAWLIWFKYFAVGLPKSTSNIAPVWYSSVRKLLWIAVSAFIVVIAVINTHYGVHQTGLVPRTIFPWPLNALLAWSLNIGCALTIAVLLAWDLASGRRLSWQPYAIVLEAFVSTVAILSRALFLFHATAQLIGLKLERWTGRYTRLQVIFFIGLTASLFAASIVAVSFSRDYQYAGTLAKPVIHKIPANAEKGEQCPAQPGLDSERQTVKPPSFRWDLLHQLVVNRWIGLEGAMVASAHEGSSMQLLQTLLLEKREIGKATAYQKISNSGYQLDDPKFQFATMPGIAGFMYLGGSLWVVMAGVALLVSIAIAGEWLLSRLTHNPLFCSLYGITAANALAQFGVTPRQDLPQFIMIFAMGFVIYILQSRYQRKL